MTGAPVENLPIFSGDDWIELEAAQCDLLVAFEVIRDLRAQVDGWRKAHGLCLDAIERLSAALKEREA